MCLRKAARKDGVDTGLVFGREWMAAAQYRALGRCAGLGVTGLSLPPLDYVDGCGDSWPLAVKQGEWQVCG